MVYRISVNSFRRNYSFLRLKYIGYFHILSAITLLLFSKCCSNYLRVENYSRAETICGNKVCTVGLSSITPWLISHWMRPINYRAQLHTCLNELQGKLQKTKKTCEKLQLFDVFFIQLCRNISEPNKLPKSKAIQAPTLIQPCTTKTLVTKITAQCIQPWILWVFELFTANIFNVIFTLFKCVPLSTVISLYDLLLIAAPSTVE